MNGTVRRNLIIILFVLVLQLVNNLPLKAAEVVILHTNDVHSRLESYLPLDGEREQGGRVRLATVVEEIRNEYGANKVLLLDAGDSIYGGHIDTFFGGLPSIEVMEAMGYDAFTLGNHEFNHGQEVLEERIRNADFPVLAANITKEDNSLFTGNSAMITEIDGVKVGIIGLVGEDTPRATNPKNVVGLVFHNPITIAKNLVRSLRPRVDLLVVLSHMGYEQDVQLANEIPEIDVIVGGHSHTKLEKAREINGVLIVQSGEHANNLGFLYLEFAEGKIVKHDSKLIPITSDIPKNIAVQTIVTDWNNHLQQHLNQIIRETAINWQGEREHIQTGETNLGNLIADIIKKSFGADIALINSNVIERNLPQGKIKVSDIYQTLPSDNKVAVVRLLGMDIIDALEHSIRLLPEENSGFLQVSGINFEVISSGLPGGRVINVKVGILPIAAGNYYTVAISDYLAAGGDGYEMFKNGQLVANTGIMLRDVIIEYLSKHEVEEPKSNRITIFN